MKSRLRRTVAALFSLMALLPAPLRAQGLHREIEQPLFHPAIELVRGQIQLVPEPDTVTFYMVGDVMSHGRMLRSAGEMYAGDSDNVHERFDYSSFFKYLEDDIKGADVAICNMEFPLAGPPFRGYPLFSGPDSYPYYLARTGFDVLLLANNHILDQGSAGASRTVQVLDQVVDSTGVFYTGMSSDEADDQARNPLILTVKGLKVAIVNFTYGSNLAGQGKWPKVNMMDRQEISRSIARAKAANVDLIFALPHWGEEYHHRHSASQEAMAEWLVSEGTDLIVGAHPHVAQDTTTINGVPVIYSLGNAVSNQNDLPARLELAVTVKVVVAPLTGEKKLLPPELEFLWCTKPGMVEESYTVMKVKDVIGREDLWKDPADQANMANTYWKVLEDTGIEDDPR